MENGDCESFNSKLHDELLNGEIFYSLAHAVRRIGVTQRTFHRIEKNIGRFSPLSGSRRNFPHIFPSRLNSWSLVLPLIPCKRFGVEPAIFRGFATAATAKQLPWIRGWGERS